MNMPSRANSSNPTKMQAKQDTQFGLALSQGLNIKPKFKKIKNMASGNTSVLLNGSRPKLDPSKEIDLDMEALKLKVCLRKEIPYEEIELPEDKKMQQEKRKNFNDKKRLKMIKDLKISHPGAVSLLRHNAKILNSWIAYVVGPLS